VQCVHLNPKAITIEELYGSIVHSTEQYQDGLAAKYIREFTNDVSEDNKWILFDGPIDPSWIENMNTVLDDTKVLCLPNGERVKLKESLKLLFEVTDLS